MAPLTAYRTVQTDDLAVVRNFPDGHAGGIPDPTFRDAPNRRQHHARSNMLLGAQGLDGAHQIRTPAQPDTVTLHGPKARNNGWQEHTNPPSFLYNTDYTIVKRTLSTGSLFVKIFVFWAKKEKKLAFSPVL
jgi:hypothetical protein